MLTQYDMSKKLVGKGPEKGLNPVFEPPEKMLSLVESSKKRKPKDEFIDILKETVYEEVSKEKKVRVEKDGDYDKEVGIDEHVKSFFSKEEVNGECDCSSQHFIDRMIKCLENGLTTLDLSGSCGSFEERNLPSFSKEEDKEDNECFSSILNFLLHHPEITGIDVSYTDFNGDTLEKVFEQCKLEKIFFYGSGCSLGEDERAFESIMKNKYLKYLGFSTQEEEDYVKRNIIISISKSTIENIIIKGYVRMKDISFILNTNDRLRYANFMLEELFGDEGCISKDKLKKDFLRTREELFNLRKMSFLMGSHEKLGKESPVLMFSKKAGRAFKDISRDIFEYIKPNKIKLDFT